jgi:hypothetical protein
LSSNKDLPGKQIRRIICPIFRTAKTVTKTKPIEITAIEQLYLLID